MKIGSNPPKEYPRRKANLHQTFSLLEMPGKKFVLFWVVGALEFN